MNPVIQAIAAVVVGALLSMFASVVVQHLQWQREDNVRRLTWEREVANDLRTRRYEAFRQYLVAANQFNALRIRLDALSSDDKLGDEAVQEEFRKSIVDAQLKVQEAEPAAYILVANDGALHATL